MARTDILTLPDCFMVKVRIDFASGCWVWVASLNATGYGQFRFPRPGGGQDSFLAHRFSYMTLAGPIPEGLHLDHLCRNRACVNPAHLEPVTPRENTLRALPFGTYGKANRRKTHCPVGHPYDETNTRLDVRGRRYCRACQTDRNDAIPAAVPATVCRMGHPYVGDNVRLSPRGRSCRECRNDRQRRYRAGVAARG